MLEETLRSEFEFLVFFGAAVRILTLSFPFFLNIIILKRNVLPGLPEGKS